MIRHTYGWLLASLLVLPFGCSGEDTSSMGGEDFAGPNNTDNPPSTGIGQGGGQDFGLFRQILEAGALPGLGTLDAIGFFAEHKLDYPAANCGEDICVHPLLGVGLDFFNQAPFYLLQIGMNSPLKPNEMEKPPLNLVLSIDVSGSMAGESLDAVKRGLRRMLPGLRPQDKLSIVTYSDEAEVLFQGMTIASQGTLTAAVELLQPLGGTNIYDGLFVAYQVALEQRAEGDETRVLLLSDGMITQGIPDPTRLLTLATAHARQGIGLTTIGVGREFDVDLMRGLSEVGAGGFYFLENPSAVDEVFLQEIQTFMVPVALNARLEVKVDEGHRVRGAYGVRGWDNGVRSGGVSMPVLFLAGRQSAGEPTGEGRRGGGG
ncbi:VWA domain-containing protein, partial [Myxococcota bacterium]|nr:VWA domain-containing protein [Myxococcota bacterium]